MLKFYNKLDPFSATKNAQAKKLEEDKVLYSNVFRKGQEGLSFRDRLYSLKRNKYRQKYYYYNVVVLFLWDLILIVYNFIKSLLLFIFLKLNTKKSYETTSFLEKISKQEHKLYYGIFTLFSRKTWENKNKFYIFVASFVFFSIALVTYWAYNAFLQGELDSKYVEWYLYIRRNTIQQMVLDLLQVIWKILDDFWEMELEHMFGWIVNILWAFIISFVKILIEIFTSLYKYLHYNIWYLPMYIKTSIPEEWIALRNDFRETCDFISPYLFDKVDYIFSKEGFYQIYLFIKWFILLPFNIILWFILNSLIMMSNYDLTLLFDYLFYFYIYMFFWPWMEFFLDSFDSFYNLYKYLLYLIINYVQNIINWSFYENIIYLKQNYMYYIVKKSTFSLTEQSFPYIFYIKESYLTIKIGLISLIEYIKIEWLYYNLDITYINNIYNILQYWFNRWDVIWQKIHMFPHYTDFKIPEWTYTWIHAKWFHIPDEITLSNFIFFVFFFPFIVLIELFKSLLFISKYFLYFPFNIKYDFIISISSLLIISLIIGKTRLWDFFNKQKKTNKDSDLLDLGYLIIEKSVFYLNNSYKSIKTLNSRLNEKKNYSWKDHFTYHTWRIQKEKPDVEKLYKTQLIRINWESERFFVDLFRQIVRFLSWTGKTAEEVERDELLAHRELTKQVRDLEKRYRVDWTLQSQVDDDVYIWHKDFRSKHADKAAISKSVSSKDENIKFSGTLIKLYKKTYTGPSTPGSNIIDFDELKHNSRDIKTDAYLSDKDIRF